MSDNKKNVIVIGAGIAGLSAAIYARRSGFDVTIYESHFIPGGLSTSWTRKGYLFEGGMHWLTGSSPKSPLNKVWKELGALQENNPILVKDPFYTLIDGDKQLCLFRDVDKLEKHFVEFAPEDKKMIKKMCRDIKIFQGVHCIVGDIPGLKAQTPSNPGLKELLGMVPAATRLLPLINESYIHYVNRFKNNSIRHLLMTVIGDRYNALSLIYTLATFSTGDCGYPIGGSIRMAQNMAKTFEDLGGKIQYKSFVDQVVIQKGKVKGIMCKEEFIPCDSVIVTQDARSAIDTLFGPSLKDKWVSKMRNDTIGEQNMFICLGVKHSFSNLPKAVVYPLDKPFKAGGLEFNELRINNYSEYKDHAPEGCTTLTCLLLGECYDYWQKAKEDGSYKEKKKDLCDRFISELTKFMPEIADNIEVTDVATPCTYERYCHTYKGSWMSVWEPKGKARNYPIKAKTVKGLYFAGQRVQMPGGLPIAVGTGRTAAQYLCRDNGVKFI